MTEHICQYSGDREQAIVSYLYADEGAFDAVERTAFAAHVATCEGCRAELAAFEGVRTTLGQWSPPRLRSDDSPSFGAAGPMPNVAETRRRGDGAKAAGARSWREIPAWAQVAAALLCLGVGAGLANLNVRYDANGLQVRTGWSTAVPVPVAQVSQPVAEASQDAAPWRAEMTALEQRLRTDLRQTPAQGGNLANAATAANPAIANVNSETLRRVRALIDESERRQQTELALRLGEAVREANAQRQADLVRIDRNIGAMQNNTGREMLRQRNEMLNYVSIRTAAQRP
jgi:hypothetical protein